MSTTPKKISHPTPISRPPDDIERPLPSAIEAERHILGAINLDDCLLSLAREHVRPEDLFLLQHRCIFEAMVRLSEKECPISTVSLLEELRHSGKLEAAGGVAYLSQLADGLPRTGPKEVSHYARLVRAKAILRTTIYYAAAIQEDAFEADEPRVVLDRAQELFSSVREGITANGQEDLTCTPHETCSRARETIDYIAYPLAVPGMMSLVDGAPKLAGKTTLILAAIAAGKRDGLFLNKATGLSRILYVTEEGEETFAIALRKAGLDAVQSDITILYNFRMPGWTWERKVKYIEELCAAHKITWLILDTFFKIVGLGPDKEKDASTVSAAVDPIRQITSRIGLASTLCRHERKSGGEVGKSGRGSNALDGEVDIIARIQRLRGNQDFQRREIEVVSRIANEKIQIELSRDGEYKIVNYYDVFDPEADHRQCHPRHGPRYRVSLSP